MSSFTLKMDRHPAQISGDEIREHLARLERHVRFLKQELAGRTGDGNTKTWSYIDNYGNYCGPYQSRGEAIDAAIAALGDNVDHDTIVYQRIVEVYI